jgi:sec-independent protein translocase protein TatA
MGSLPGGWELILILAVIVLVFGAKRLPDSARSLGRSMRILKSEVKGMKDDDAAVTPTTTVAQVDAPVPTPPPVASTPPVTETPTSPVTRQSRQP